MLDASDASGDRRTDCTRRVGVNRNVGAPVFRGIDRGPELRFSVLRHVDRVVRRGDASTAHQLDLACAQHELFAHPAHHRVGPVSNHRGARRLRETEGRAASGRHFVSAAEIAVAGGL